MRELDEFVLCKSYIAVCVIHLTSSCRFAIIEMGISGKWHALIVDIVDRRERHEQNGYMLHLLITLHYDCVVGSALNTPSVYACEDRDREEVEEQKEGC